MIGPAASPRLRKTASLAAAFFLLSLAPRSWAGFAQSDITLTDTGADIALFDCNDDGRLDIVIADRSATANHESKVLRNDGASGFTEVAVPENINNYRAVSVGDVDRDGHIDIVFVGVDAASDGIWRVWKGDGSCGFTLGWGTTEAGTFTYYRSHLADLDNDGALDLIASDTTRLGIRYNDGAGNFGVFNATGAMASYAMQTADFNKDGRLDIMAGMGTAPVLRVLRNNANHSFTMISLPDSGATIPRAVAVGDLDNDGRYDAVVAQNANPGLWAVYRSTSDNFGFVISYSSAGVAAIAGQHSDAEIADYDGDGDGDILFGQGYNNATYPVMRVVQATTPATGFSLQLRTGVQNGQAAAWGDLNDDGRLDVAAPRAGGAAAGSGPAAPIIRYNADTGQSIRLAPNPPTTGFGVSAVGSTFTFTWGEGSDPIAGSTVSYVVAIATKTMTVSALSSTTTWPSKLTIGGGGSFSLSPAYGSPFQPMMMTRTTSNTNRLIITLPVSATYYWRVATINSGNKRSAWSDEQNTLGGPAAPTINGFLMVGASSITAGWNLVAGATGYTLDASLSATNPPTVIAASSTTATINATTATVFTPALAVNTTYYLFVRQNTNGASSSYTAYPATSTLALPPASVTSTFSAVGASGFTVSFSTNGNPVSVTSYTVQASTATDFTGASDVSVTTAPAGSNAAMRFSGLSTFATYYVRARALNHNDVPTEWVSLGSTYTAFSQANVPLTAASTFSAVTISGFSALWDRNENPLVLTTYTVQVSTASDFNTGATDQVSFTTIPALGPMATFTNLNQNTVYYFRVRARHPDGTFTAYTELGSTRTLPSSALPSESDGLLLFGQAANSIPQFQAYISSAIDFHGPYNTVSGADGSVFVIKASPRTDKREAIAGYVRHGTLYVMCYDGMEWSNEWNVTVGGQETTRRFDITFERSSGDAMVLYSQNAGATNELGYRTKPGTAGCGGSNWAGASNLDPARTSGVVHWVKVAADRSSGSNAIAAIWADAASDLSAMVWDGGAWTNEPGTALSTTLEVVTAAHDVENFDVRFESLSGDIMVVWGDAAGNATTSGVRYASATYTGGSPLHSWSAVGTPPTMANDATNLDLAPDPNSNEMVFASLGNAGSDLQAANWSGSSWTAQNDLDAAAGTPLAGTKLVAAGWVSTGGTRRSIITYADATGPTLIGWYTGSGGVFTVQTDSGPVPAFGSPQKLYDIQQDPFNDDRLFFAVTDLNNDLIIKRLQMVNNTPTFSWADANQGSAVETNLASATVAGFSFALWPSTAQPTFTQSAYRFFGPTETTDVGAALAAQDTAAVLATAGASFRLRTLLHVGQTQLNTGAQGFKLQYVGKGSGSCDAPSGGTPASYTDVTASTLIAFEDRTPADNAALTANADDPRHGAHANVSQAYEELNNSTNSVAAIPALSDGQWDFALKANGAAGNTRYCLRLVKGDGSALNSYESYPELLTANAANVGLTITGDPYDFESVPLNTTTHSTRAITVTNTGDVNEDFSMRANTTTANSPWTLAHTVGTGAGYDRLLLQAVFKAAIPSSADFESFTTVVSTTTRAASATIYTADGSYVGSAVAPAAARNLWFKFTLPSSTSLGNPPGQQEITVTVTADQSP